MTTTPNSPQELFNLNQKPQLTGEQVMEVIDQLTPVQTIRLTRFLLQRLEEFHWSITDDINNGECDQPFAPWHHDATLLSNISILFNNLTDFQD